MRSEDEEHDEFPCPFGLCRRCGGERFFFATNHAWQCVRVIGTSVEDYVAHSRRLLSM